jgi:hypothetical protein
MSRSFHARVINSPHRPTPPLSLVSLSFPKPVDGSFPATEEQIERGGRAPSSLLRRLHRYEYYLASSSATKDPCTGRTSTASNFAMSVRLKKTSAPLFHHRSARIWIADARLMTCMAMVRVKSDYCAEFVSS